MGTLMLVKGPIVGALITIRRSGYCVIRVANQIQDPESPPGADSFFAPQREFARHSGMRL